MSLLHPWHIYASHTNKPQRRPCVVGLDSRCSELCKMPGQASKQRRLAKILLRLMQRKRRTRGWYHEQKTSWHRDELCKFRSLHLRVGARRTCDTLTDGCSLGSMLAESSRDKPDICRFSGFSVCDLFLPPVGTLLQQSPGSAKTELKQPATPSEGASESLALVTCAPAWNVRATAHRH